MSGIDLFLLGDFNIKIDNINDYNPQHFKKLLQNFSLSHHVLFPTHDSGHVLDLIITNVSSKFNIHPFCIDTCISDHKTVCVDRNLAKPHIKKNIFSYRHIKNINFTQFNQDISVAFCNFEHLDLDSLVNYFNSTLSPIFDKYAPLKIVTVTPHTSNPWFTSNLLNERCKRRQLESHWCKSRNESDKLLNKKQCHMYNSLLKKGQSNYFSSLFDHCLGSKSLWLSNEKMLHRSNPSLQISPSIHSADQYSSFFSDKIKTLGLNLPLIKVNPYSVPDILPPTFSSFKPASLMKLSNLYYHLCNLLASLIPYLLISYLAVSTIFFP